MYWLESNLNNRILIYEVVACCAVISKAKIRESNMKIYQTRDDVSGVDVEYRQCKPFIVVYLPLKHEEENVHCFRNFD